MTPWILLAIWLIVGWVFTVWFVNFFLIDRRFTGHSEEVGTFLLIMLTIVGPMMAVVMLLVYVIQAMSHLRINELVRKVYLIR